tara:strand:+ start:166 stop:324 length:159 start_codon:yes stop_codon:yes gene_type:complete
MPLLNALIERLENVAGCSLDCPVDLSAMNSFVLVVIAVKTCFIQAKPKIGVV